MSKDFYLSKQGVKEYLQLSSDSDSSFVIESFRKSLKKEATILELGSGPGRDLSTFENVTYSDFSPLFIDLLKKKHPNNSVLQLDAVSINTKESFDAIYSNKVLHHLSDDDLLKSIKRQYEVLIDEGIICHTFWEGEKNEEFKGLLFNHHTKAELESLMNDRFEILTIEEYEEFLPGDSLLLIAKKK